MYVIGIDTLGYDFIIYVFLRVYILGHTSNSYELSF